MCIHCQSKTKQFSWPSAEVERLITFVRNYESRAPEYSQVVSVFTSSLLELLLEELVTKVAYEDLTYDQGFLLVDALLEAYQGRNRLFSLYKRVGYGSFHEAVRDIGHGKFLLNWDTIVTIRNKVVHGKANEVDELKLLMMPWMSSTGCTTDITKNLSFIDMQSRRRIVRAMRTERQTIDRT